MPNLTPREWRIAELVSAGEKNADIGRILGTTENVVKNYVCRLFDKLGLHNRVELALWHLHRTFRTKE